MYRKRIQAVFTILVLIICFWGSIVASADAAKKRIGIVKFDCDFTVRFPTGNRYDIGTGASDLLATALFKNKTFQVFEREQLRSVLQEQGFEQSGAVDPSTAVEMGKLAGLDYIVYGKVVSAGAENQNTTFGGLALSSKVIKTVVAVRMIDIKTGALVIAEQAEGNVSKTSGNLIGLGGQVNTESAEVYDRALGKAIDIIAKKISDTNPIEGSVAQVIGKQIYLDIGAEQGVAVGQRFHVYKEGPSILNANGEVIGVAKAEIGWIKIVSVEGNMSVAQADNTSLDIKTNDKVRAL